MPRAKVVVDTKGFGRLASAYDHAIQLGLHASGVIVAQEAQASYGENVRTGKTRDSIRTTLPERGRRGWYLRVYVGTWYGRFVETGRKSGAKTGRMKGARGLRKALYGGGVTVLAENIGRAVR